MSRQFRESLKTGKPELTDNIIKLPDAKHNIVTKDTVRYNNNTKYNIVYRSRDPKRDDDSDEQEES